MNDPKVIYIAGPMSGLPQYNCPAFEEAERLLKNWFPDSAIINPAKNFGDDRTLDYAIYMRQSIHQLLMADAICLLPEWENSRGARIEREIADCLNLKVFRVQSDGLLRFCSKTHDGADVEVC